jgi:hypothetical protein
MAKAKTKKGPGSKMSVPIVTTASPNKGKKGKKKGKRGK